MGGVITPPKPLHRYATGTSTGVETGGEGSERANPTSATVGLTLGLCRNSKNFGSGVWWGGTVEWDGMDGRLG